MQTKYHLCVDNTIYTDNELNGNTDIINSTYLVDTSLTKSLTEKQIKNKIFNYIYGNGQQPKWLSKYKSVWKGTH